MTKEGRALRPESRGRVLSAFLQHYFAHYVDYGFTAPLEDQLDHVSGQESSLKCPSPHDVQRMCLCIHHWGGNPARMEMSHP